MYLFVHEALKLPAKSYRLPAIYYMSVIKHSDQRVAVFIDTQNLYHSAKNLYNTKVNFGAIMETAIGKRKLIRSIAYVITTEAGDETQFFEALTKLGIETKTKDLQVFYGGAKKGDWDLGIAMDAIRLGHKVDSIILVSGDGDFKPVVNYLQQSLGCLVEVVAFKKTTNKELIEIADDYINIEDNARKLLFRI